MPCCGARALLRSRGDIHYKLRLIKKRPLRSGPWGADTRGSVGLFLQVVCRVLGGILDVLRHMFGFALCLIELPFSLRVAVARKTANRILYRPLRLIPFAC